MSEGILRAGLEDTITAVAIRVGARWFYAFGARGRVQTAWCLAGAKLYQASDVPRALKRIRAAVERAAKSRHITAPTVEAVVIGPRRASESTDGKLLAVAGFGAAVGAFVGTIARGATVTERKASDAVPYRFGFIGDGRSTADAIGSPAPSPRGPGSSGETGGASGATEVGSVDGSEPRDPDNVQWRCARASCGATYPHDLADCETL